MPAQTTLARSSDWSCISFVVPWSISRLSARTASFVISPAAIRSMSRSSSAVISGVAMRGTYCLNALYIAIPVSDGIGGFE